MNTVSALLFRSISDGGSQTNDSRLALLLAGFRDGRVDPGKIAKFLLRTALIPRRTYSRIAVIDVEDLPAVGEEPLLNVLSEGDGGVSVN